MQLIRVCRILVISMFVYHTGLCCSFKIPSDINLKGGLSCQRKGVVHPESGFFRSPHIQALCCEKKKTSIDGICATEMPLWVDCT